MGLALGSASVCRSSRRAPSDNLERFGDPIIEALPPGLKPVGGLVAAEARSFKASLKTISTQAQYRGPATIHRTDVPPVRPGGDARCSLNPGSSAAVTITSSVYE